MDSSVSLKDEIRFLRVCHHISTGLYLRSSETKPCYWKKTAITGLPSILWHNVRVAEPGWCCGCSDRAMSKASRGQSPGRVNIFLFPKTSRMALGPTEPHAVGTGAVSCGVTWPGREADRVKEFMELYFCYVDRDSSVGMATHCGLDGPGIESQWGRDFPHPSRPALGPTQPPIQCVPVFSRGYSGTGVVLTTYHQLPSSTEVKERVGICLLLYGYWVFPGGRATEAWCLSPTINFHLAPRLKKE